MKTLFDEAIEALGNITTLSKEDGNDVVAEFENTFPFITSGNGKLNWNAIDNSLIINDEQNILINPCYSNDNECFIIWNDQSLNVICTKLKDIIQAFDDVTAVSFDTWIFIPSTGNVIENIFGSLRITTNNL